MDGGTDPPRKNWFKGLPPEVILDQNQNSNKKPKRKRPSDDFPEPPVINNDNNIPRFIVVTGLEKTGENIRSLSSYNPIQINRGLEFISKDILEVKAMRSGDLLLKVLNVETANKFLKAKLVDSIPVKVTNHLSLNSIQGRIYSKHIVDISEEELLSELKKFKVIDVKKMMRKQDDSLVATGAAILTFDLIRRPNEVKIGWVNCKVDEYIPNPMRCISCQKLGHTKNRCTGAPLCKNCCLPPPHDSCTRVFCLNCNTEGHTPSDPACPSFLRYKSVNKIKIDRRCTVRDAWQIFNDNPSIHQLPAPKNRNFGSSTMADIIKTRIEKTKQQHALNNKLKNTTASPPTNELLQTASSLTSIVLSNDNETSNDRINLSLSPISDSENDAEMEAGGSEIPSQSSVTSPASKQTLLNKSYDRTLLDHETINTPNTLITSTNHNPSQ
ncbi:uncharacterized protein LOC129948925 [Eupeodes corollae]|uniref:uncharacterized protein LOC129948925 n=1 Tax=Eupeodes corollae TaxID=290404 RepID=UPI002493C8BC|nr:uncharacterized protein LOC129948925 [Eupeodes corollae]